MEDSADRIAKRAQFFSFGTNDLTQTAWGFSRDDVEAAFFMRGTPVEQVRAVAATGESMPPKSTYFFPKVLTGMVFNPLD